MCPPGTLIPGEEWLRLQFWPKNVHTKRALQHTGRLKIKYMIQQRQFRQEHEDSHYVSAIFKYQREAAIKFQHYSIFLSVDDKHHIKIGEPGFPVASIERGRCVLVALDKSFQVGDHDFTKFSLVPSVTFNINIPNDIAGSWYTGDVSVIIKEAAFEPSSPYRHSCEMYKLVHGSISQPIMFIYSDGGPDHRLTYLSVQVSLIALFLRLDLDYLCACRTAPHHSFRNPVERTMSTLNLGLQTVGLMRQKGSDEFESIVNRCKQLADFRNVAKSNLQLPSPVLDSVTPCKILLANVFSRLKFKEKNVSVGTSATLEEINDHLSVLHNIEPNLQLDKVLRKDSLAHLPNLKAFLDHCCTRKQYIFEIKKCGIATCTICRPVCLPHCIFSEVHFLPDPVPGDDGHYKPFHEIYGTVTSEAHRPSLHKRPATKKALPFRASLKYVKNVNMMLLCQDCNMWRLLYSKYKLDVHEKQNLEMALEGMSYTCGSMIQDLGLTGRLSDVYVCDHRCNDLIETLYYKANYDPICIYCGEPQNYADTKAYPKCNSCKDRPSIKK